MILFAGVFLNSAATGWFVWLETKDSDLLIGSIFCVWLWAIIDFVKIIKGSFGDKENRGLS